MAGVLLVCPRFATADTAGGGWIVLSDDLGQFQKPTGQWYVAGNACVDAKMPARLIGGPGKGVLIDGKDGVTDNLVTRDKWGDIEVSLDFLIPQNSNSGVKLHGVYEIQIADTWKVAKPTGNDCGGIYPRAELKTNPPKYYHIDEGIAPRVNAAKAPGEWQTLQIVFRAPRFDGTGRNVSHARFEKVLLNGKLIHDNVEVAHPTGHVWREPEHAVGPLLLQADHGPVAFRNVRVRPLGTYSVATFNADITIPVGHACMGGGVADAKRIIDPLFAKGFVLLGAGRPIVVVALDWCQCNNDSYDRWRDVLAEAAGTTRQRVMLATVHQHDAPICDLTAQKLLNRQGLKGYNCDLDFHEKAVQQTAQALKTSLAAPQRVTHFGVGQAKVEKVASNRRIVTPEGRITWDRASSSGDMYGAPEGGIDPWLKTVSLWHGDRAVLAWSSYAVHPMSHYGQGEVSADFPGMARARRQQDNAELFQMYFTGCAGDTTAGKYNTGAPENRPVLADRLYQAMVSAWKSTHRHPLDKVVFRVAAMPLPARNDGDYTIDAMRRILADEKAGRWPRIMAAIGLSWRKRVDAGQPIDVPCLELGGVAQFVIMPAETFVGYQLIAQRLRPDCFVVVAGFGDGAAGYIPTDQCWRDSYNDPYCWVPKMTQTLMTKALAEALNAKTSR
jgi:hypothetical protein